VGHFFGVARREDRFVKIAAVKSSAFLSAMFLAVYGGCNWITGHRAHVGVWYFGWECHIPFVPMMVVPYLSIDAFFIAAPFLCRDRLELDVFVRRVSAAILAAGACFLVMPLHFAFARPDVSGWPAALLGAFLSFDRPFNMFPSLHIALAVILADTYSRHTKGLVRMAAVTWFILIALSTVFTYQHHVIDVAGGLALAALVFASVPVAHTHSFVPNRRVGSYYLLGAGAIAALAMATSPWGAVLLWPAAGLAVGGSASIATGPTVFRKSNGSMAVSTWFLLWPCLIGQWISLWYYRGRCRPYDEIVHGVLMGERLREQEAANALSRGVTAVLDLTAELSEAKAFRCVTYRNIQVVDLTAPTVDQLGEAATFIAEQSTRGIVYVHCKAGYSRSAAAVGAYLLASGRARTPDEAIAIIRQARPSIVVRPEVLQCLRRFEAALALGGTRDEALRSISAAIAFQLFAGVARLICGTAPRWVGCAPSTRQRIYFANHTSHLDALVLLAALPADVRANTRPVAGRDYWDRRGIRRYVARQVFNAVLIERHQSNVAANRHALVASARRSVERTAAALGTEASLIIFPEGTRGSGPDVSPFKSGLYYLCRLRPDVELVPVYLENLHRVFPKGALLPVPFNASVIFGRPIRLEPGEDKHAFLTRARVALMMVDRTCASSSTVISRAS
jgi:1-acyl-sn-glycerol-3-phosphate acyltransferase/membrane-associated phospholipid phosphatase